MAQARTCLTPKGSPTTPTDRTCLRPGGIARCAASSRKSSIERNGRNDEMKMNLKRLALISTAFVSLTGAVAAQQNVVWWDFLAGGDGIRMKALIDGFNAEHSGEIQIQATTLEWGTPFYTKLQTSAAIGEGPDIATYHLSRIPLAVDSGTLSEISDDDLAGAGISDADFTEAAVQAARGD